MQRFKEVTFKNHPVLGNLHLDFTDVNGHAASTVLIAGENGVGKSCREKRQLGILVLS